MAQIEGKQLNASNPEKAHARRVSRLSLVSRASTQREVQGAENRKLIQSPSAYAT
jgi:hypothetical protein